MVSGRRAATSTDHHWSERAASVRDDAEVNIMDVFQRDLEYDHVCSYLRPEMRVLEVGCGNGYSTKRFRALVKHVDAFDFSESMISRARSAVGETNNRFIHDDVLDLRRIRGRYDTVVCVRVLINLRNLDEQRQAVRSLATRLEPGGLFLLVEGFQDGFEGLDRLRTEAGLPKLTPAPINFYSRMEDLQPEIERHFSLEESFHLGAYDYLTRVVFPLLVGADNVRHNTVFSERCQLLARAWNPPAFEPFSRLRGLVLRRLAG